MEECLVVVDVVVKFDQCVIRMLVDVEQLRL